MTTQNNYQRIGQYTLIKTIGEGGMSAVYLAQDKKGKQVALKVLPRSLARDTAALERFQREAAVSMGLDHPNIVQCLDIDNADGYHYMAMEYVPGGDAESLLVASGGRLDEKRVFEIALDITRALEFAGAFGLVHRDIKPENILFNPDGMARLTDFGLVKHEMTAGKITSHGKAMGTPHFMSPEQARGQRMLDIRTDFFSLGSTCYYLLTGVLAFDGDSPYEIVTTIVNSPPLPIREVRADISPQGAMIIEHLMAYNPMERPENPARLASIIERHLAGESLEPLPPYIKTGHVSPATDGSAGVLKSDWDEFATRTRKLEATAKIANDARKQTSKESPVRRPFTGTDSSHRRRKEIGSSDSSRRRKRRVRPEGADAETPARPPVAPTAVTTPDANRPFYLFLSVFVFTGLALIAAMVALAIYISVNKPIDGNGVQQPVNTIVDPSIDAVVDRPLPTPSIPDVSPAPNLSSSSPTLSGSSVSPE
ncbi:MAG: serine/threonine-protein kinase [Planctomycetota bacterium]